MCVGGGGIIYYLVATNIKGVAGAVKEISLLVDCFIVSFVATLATSCFLTYYNFGDSRFFEGLFNCFIKV